MMRYADVIVPLPLHDSYTYSIPSALESSVRKGCRVLVPFGKSKSYVGIVHTVHTKEPQGYEVKSIKECLDTLPVVTDTQFRFWKWIAQYYACPLGDVMNAALPARLKADKPTKPSSKKDSAATNLDTHIYEESTGGGFHALNKPQQQAFDAICQSFITKDVTLLHGITSSGKTEIYIHLIRQALSEGKQVLYLLPEIALTTQITERLRSVFGEQMGVFHSKFSDAARVAVYRKQLSDEPYQLVLGVRSSVFLPFCQLGLVIVDEEHEVSYKQQDPAPRYHARSAAIMLAHQCGAKTLLGTATPSLESFQLAHTGRYGYVSLTTRYLDCQLPEIEVVDIKRLKFQKQMKGIFSPVLIESIGNALAHGEQVILFLNRRGYANFLMCKTCGWVPRCPHCDVSLTYHKKTNRLVCHYCGQAYMLPPSCPSCGEPRLSDVGIGTEKVEQQIHRHFPEATTVRMDIDTAHTRAAYEQIITDFSHHQYDILIGTQMVTKGLDFDNVSVVGILDADTMLHLPDFRSAERTYHVLAQVAGRAGRRNHRGLVVLQTRSADSDIIAHVVHNDYESMFRTQMEERRQFHYPPFYRLINIYLRHNDYSRTEQLAHELGDLLRQTFGDRVLGPDRPAVARVRSMYVRKLMLKIEKQASANKVRSLLFDIQARLLQQPSAHGVQIYYDVDPM
jgi:primosomal protein N' (replication factor Y)